jgi:regulatory protein
MPRGARPAPARSLKARAIQWLAQREHSRLELRRKLLPYALAEDARVRDAAGAGGDGAASDPADTQLVAATDAFARLDTLLDWLQANHYLSDQRFVESRVHARASRFGNLRIRQELAQHQVALSASVESALKSSELARARAVWAAKFSARSANANEHAKQARFLAGRGFSGAVIRQVLREAGQRGARDEAAAHEPGHDLD